MVKNLHEVAQIIFEYCIEQKLKSIKKADTKLFYSYCIDEEKVDLLLKNIFDKGFKC